MSPTFRTVRGIVAEQVGEMTPRLPSGDDLQSGTPRMGKLDCRMTIDFEFQNDHEFRKLLMRSSNVDLTVLALELARDGQPDLDFDHTLNWISRRADEVRSHLTRARNDRAMLRELSKCLYGTHGLHGDKEAFHRSESSYINRVIETGVGIPISLSLVYVAVAQNAGVELEGVAAPMHFLSRLETIEGPLFVDAFHQGEVLNYDECCSWLESLSGLDTDQIESALEPAKPRDIVIRMLNNLKAVQVKQECWEQAWHVQRRLSALHPGSFDQRRDLALVALKSNRPGLAIDLLEGCLKSCTALDQPILQAHLLVAEKLLAGMN